MWNSDTVARVARASSAYPKPLPRVGLLGRWWRRLCTHMLDGKPDPGLPVWLRW